MKTPVRLFIGLILLISLLILSACSDLGYYWHSTRGHFDIINRRADIEELIKNETTAEELREKLQLVQSIREFAKTRLDLPVGNSYSEYVELDRPYALQNLFAAPEFSTQLKSWCYPFAGCASYRGYFEEERMNRYVEKLKKENFEIHIGQVSAYSTLGWFDDPVLSSFINWRDYRLAGLLFHELTHQRLYIDNDTTFNESLASAVQQIGTEIWLEQQNRLEDLERYNRWLIYRSQVIKLIQQTRRELTQLYASSDDDQFRRFEKQSIFEKSKQKHDSLADKNNVKGGYRKWFSSELNNAKIGSISAYNDQLPAFVAIFRHHINNFSEAYKIIEKIGNLDKTKRDNCLDAWLKQQPPGIECPD